MKKIATLFFLCICFGLYSLTVPPSTSMVAVLSDQPYLLTNQEEYHYFGLSDQDGLLTTHNLLDYFQDRSIRIVGLYPDISTLYQVPLNQYRYYPFSFSSYSQNLERMDLFYEKLYKRNGYQEMSDAIYLYGVSIALVKVYTSNGCLYQFLLEHPDFEYQILDS